MSGGCACDCTERRKPIAERAWRVVQRNCNHSAFSGCRYTVSDYSCITCMACGRFWRTKAQYVSKLKDQECD
jgi:hypothetical protein